jgi:hypothetical protein
LQKELRAIKAPEFKSDLAWVLCAQPIHIHRRQRAFHPAPSAHYFEP